MKKIVFALFTLSLILLNACNHVEKDYRVQWTGFYSCKVHSSFGISNTGEVMESDYTDTMMVSMAADSCLEVSSLTNDKVWTFSVDEAGNVISGSVNFKAGSVSEGVFSKNEFSFIYSDYGVNVSRHYEVEGHRLNKTVQ
jgi:hypothetical protein